MERLIAPWRTLLRRRAFVVLLTCNLLLGLATSFVGPFMSMFGTLEVRMSPLVFSVFMTITSVSAIVIGTYLAHRSDLHYSRRTMLVLGCGAGFVGYAGYAFVRDPLTLTLIGSLVLGIASIVFSQLFAYAREELGRAGIPARELPLYMNVFRLTFALAWTIGPAVAAWVMVKYRYRGMFLVSAGTYLVLIGVVLVFVPALPPNGAVRSLGRLSLREALRRGDLLAHFAAFVLIFLAGTLSMLDLPLLVLGELGGREQQVGIVYSVAPFFELPFMYYVGFLATRGDQTRIIRAGFALAILYYLGLSLVQAPWHVYLVQILSAAVTAVVAGVAISFFQSYLPNYPGSATNIYVSAQRAGSTVAYLVFGPLAAAIGHRSIFLICAASSVAALALLFTRTRRPVATSGAVPA
ncbi:MAG TPA: sugar efflux transporter [Candidatus Didemnitutus sp.]|jgi:SET family sugar efflux transporter-like MFS transporter